MANHEHAKLVVGLVSDTLSEILLVMDFLLGAKYSIICMYQY